MKYLNAILGTILFTFYCSCSDSDNEEFMGATEDMDPFPATAYFPPVGADMWETISLETLGWSNSAAQELSAFLEEKDTKAFLIVKDGRIVLEYYLNGSNRDEPHPWYSVGKSATAFTAGVAQAEGLLSLHSPSSTYLGEGWSNLSQNEEMTIQVSHHLSMTTGLDYTVGNLNCTEAQCLHFLNIPDSFWYYHNAPYTLTQDIISGATGVNFESYFDRKVKDPIGMDGQWLRLGFANVYFSTARSMARFGLLNLNKGFWEGSPILNDNSYFNAMTNSSQDMNKAYGYLWWLNGKENFRVPGSEMQFQGALIPNAPQDLIAGLGKDDQKLYIVPSQDLVIVRMGDATGESLLGPSSFDISLWDHINALF
ncbi:serine hydrolase domain-containing protein [Spongiimicrobium salis]|uniref:serine hydrolase domain-containing protein n=1 Tax=Spongiimicrobium salis TaxID=1667022 RepID=UPI00374CA901